MLIEKVCAGMISAQPILMPQKVVNLIGEDQFFKVNPVASQAAHEIHCLGKLNIPIVVTVNQEHR
jgi:hypothetical protein